MPTVGWIQETGWTRQTDAFPPVHDWKPDPTRCPLCPRMFVDSVELSTHLGVDHPVKLPILRIGRLVGLNAYTVREPEMLREVEAYSATECRLSTNGGQTKTCPPKQLGSQRRALENAQHHIWLSNAREVDGRQAEAELEIRVVIPDGEILKQIDSLFLKELAIDRPTMADVDRFLRTAPHDMAAAEYTGALADYVVGILIKEQDRSAGTVAPFDAFTDKLGSARRVLADFNSPLSRAVVAAINFNLNHFTLAAPTSVELLHPAHRFYASFSVSGAMPEAIAKTDSRRAALPACPIDKATNVILHALAQFPHIPGYEELKAELPGLENTPLSEYDLAKISTLKAGAAVLLGKKEAALHHLRRIEHDYHFGAWATTQLENLSKT